MQKTFLTQEGFERLKEELYFLRNNRRYEVAERLRNAIEDGDLEENAEYDAAKNEQAFVEGRIQELETILSTARVVNGSNDPDQGIQIGSKVTIKDEDGEEEHYTIVGAAEAKPSAGRISNESPLGKALLNKHAGEEVEISAPAGVFKVTIISIE
jgi:transcription elongation factor GreA